VHQFVSAEKELMAYVRRIQRKRLDRPYIPHVVGWSIIGDAQLHPTPPYNTGAFVKD
jgi:hypothetical protein